MPGPPGPRPLSAPRRRCAPRAGRSAPRGTPADRTAAGSRTASSRAPLADELGQLRDDLVQVADDAEIAELEDGRIRILVDRDDHAGALHPHLVLNRPGDPTGDVELRRDG